MQQNRPGETPGEQIGSRQGQIEFLERHLRRTGLVLQRNIAHPDRTSQQQRRPFILFLAEGQLEIGIHRTGLQPERQITRQIIGVTGQLQIIERQFHFAFQ